MQPENPDEEHATVVPLPARQAAGPVPGAGATGEDCRAIEDILVFFPGARRSRPTLSVGASAPDQGDPDSDCRKPMSRRPGGTRS